MKVCYIKSLILLVGIISLFTLKKVNAEGITLYQNGIELTSCDDCNTLVLPRTEYISDVRIDYGEPINFTSGSSVKGIANISFNGPPTIPLDSMNSCTFYIDINPFSATLTRNYYTQGEEPGNPSHDYESGFHMETAFLPVAGSSFTSNAYFMCNITNESVGRPVNFVGVQFAMGVEGGDIPSSISNATNSINQNNDINTNNILNGISQGNQNLEDINTDMDDIKDKFDESNEIGGEISDKMDTNNSLLGTISSKIQSFKDSVDGFLSGISGKLNELIFGSKVCTEDDIRLTFDDVVFTRVYLSTTGTFNNSYDSITGVSDFVPFNKGTHILLIAYNGDRLTSSAFCLYDSNKELKSCTQFNNETEFTFTPDYDGYLRTTIKRNNVIDLKLHRCKNGNQTIFGLIKDFFTNNVLGLNELDDTLGDFLDSLEGNEVLSDAHDFLLSPVNMLNSIRTTSNSSRCTNINTTMFNHPVVFPSGCFFWNRSDVSDFRNFWNILFGGSLIFTLGFQYFKVLHNAFDPTKDDLGGLNI